MTRPTREPRCALVWCGSTDQVRAFLCGLRCAAHTPSAIAGQPEPDQLLARHRAIQAAQTQQTAA